MVIKSSQKTIVIPDPNERLKRKLIHLFLIIFLMMPMLFMAFKYLNQAVPAQQPIEEKNSPSAETLKVQEPSSIKETIPAKTIHKTTLFPLKGISRQIILSEDGNTAFIAADDGGVHILELSKRESPELISTFKLPNAKYNCTTSVALSKDKKTLYVVDHMLGFYSLDISNIDKPKVLDRYKLERSRHVRLSMDGTKAYVSGPHGLLIFDISNKYALKLLSRFYYAPDIKQYRQEEYKPHIVYAPEESVKDVFEVEKDLIYVLTLHTIDVVDISNLQHPRLVTKYGTLGQPAGITVSANKTRAYIASYNSGVEILDISDATSPKPMGGYSAGYAMHTTISADGTKLYIANLNGSLDMLDVSYPYDPKHLATYNRTTSKEELRGSVLSADNNTLYVASGVVGIQIWKIK